jgi:hypothetical protein
VPRMNGFRLRCPSGLLSVLRIWVCMVLTTGLSQSLMAFGEENLPDSPRMAAAVSGHVVDESGDSIKEAKVAVLEDGTETSAVMTSDDGSFRLPAPTAACDLRVIAPGFAARTLHRQDCASEPRDLGTIELALEAGATEVVVSASRQEIAEEQIKVEMSQRILGIVPNFYVTYDPNAVPLDAKQKYKLAMRSIVDPETIGVDLASSAIQQKTRTLGGYGSGASGYAKQFAASYGTGSLDTILGSAVFPSILKQDPRYFYKGTGSVARRAVYAMSMAVICKGNNGHWQYNYSGLLGGVTAGGISNLYEPRSDRHGINVTIGNTALGIGSSAVTNLFQEFFIRKLTPRPK